jgi:hypothetical protein
VGLPYPSPRKILQSTPGQLDPPTKTEKQTANCTQTDSRGGGWSAESASEKGDRARNKTFSVELSVSKHKKGSKGWEQMPPPNAKQGVDHRSTDLLNQRAAFKLP